MKRLRLMDFFIIGTNLLILTGLAYFIGIHVGEREAVVIEKVTVTEEAPEVYYDEFYDEYYIPDIPMTYEEQTELYEAAQEFGVDYHTMLGLIERETEFRNISGDGGNAYGYCQVWRRWWGDLMTEIGATDLNVPRDNFRTACAIVAKLESQYGSLPAALTAYNKGSFDGTVTSYAVDVLEKGEKWRTA